MGAHAATGGGRTDFVARAILVLALVASAVLLFDIRQAIGFFGDDLIFLQERSLGGIDSLLAPHNEHIVIVHAALYRLSWSLFGPTNSIPIHIVGELAFLIGNVLFFLWVRKRVGEMAAAIGAVFLLFLGTAYQDLITAFQVGYTVSMMGGLGALVALEWNSRFSRPLACVALTVAVTTSSLGVPFLPGVAALLYFQDGRRFWRSYVLLVPCLIYLAWYLGWGITAESHLSLRNVLDAPIYLVESVKAATMSLTGLHRVGQPAGDILGWVATVAVVGTVGYHLIKKRTLPRPFVVALAVGCAIWLLSALGQIPGTDLRSADQSRYQYPGATFLLMILAGAFDGFRPGKILLAFMAVLAAISVACGVGLLYMDKEGLRVSSERPKAAMTALTIAGDQADPSFELGLVPYFVRGNMTQEHFHELERRYGKAGWSESEISGEDQGVKKLVDHYLVEALGIGLVSGRAERPSKCHTVVLESGQARQLATLKAGSLSLDSTDPTVKLVVGRFADGTPISVDAQATKGKGTLTFPRDTSDVPWRVAAEGTGKVRVCVSS